MNPCDDLWVCEDDSYLESEIWGHHIELPQKRIYQPPVKHNTLEEAADAYANRLVFSGSRDIWCLNTIYGILDAGLREFDREDTLIVIGGASGVDAIIEEYCRTHGWSYWVERADWNGLGVKAGMIRNVKMADIATHIGIFWDGFSRGSGHMMKLAAHHEEARGVVYFIVRMPITWSEYHGTCQSSENAELPPGVD